MTEEMSIPVNDVLPDAYPGTGARLRIEYVAGYAKDDGNRTWEALKKGAGSLKHLHFSNSVIRYLRSRTSIWC